MKIKIDHSVFLSNPRAQIAYVVASFEQAKLNAGMVEGLVNSLRDDLLGRGFSEGVPVHADPRIAVWRDTYAKFGVKPKDYPSSVESLTRRAMQEKFPRILPIIDFYNACSVQLSLPMGGYDLEAIDGDITLQHANEYDRFRALGKEVDSKVDPRHVVYKDSSKVICWLWNYKDAHITSITPATKQAIFFMDYADSGIDGLPKIEDAIKYFNSKLVELGAVPHAAGALTKDSCEVEIDLATYGIATHSFAIAGSGAKSSEAMPPLSDSKSQIDLIHSAATGDLKSLASGLSEHPFSIFKTDSGKQTVLMHATVGGHIKAVEMLLNHLQRLVDEKRVSSEEVLAFINIESKYGITALHTAVRVNVPTITGLLIEAGANDTINSNEGLSAKESAITRGHYAVAAKFLETHGKLNHVAAESAATLH
jgi:DNA/RNA-binding domain of Phe-tRNA-synthetase-like protein